MIHLVEIYLREIFNNPDEVVRDKELEKTIPLPSIEAWTSKHAAFILFKRNGSWEIHILNLDSQNSSQMKNVFSGAGASRVIATAIYLIKKKLYNKNDSLLLYADTEKKSNTWLKVVQNQFPNGLVIQKKENVLGADGVVYPIGYLIKRDARTLRIENIIAKNY